MAKLRTGLKSIWSKICSWDYLAERHRVSEEEEPHQTFQRMSRPLCDPSANRTPFLTSVRASIAPERSDFNQSAVASAAHVTN